MSSTSTSTCVVTAALTGVLTDPAQHPVPVTPAQMAAEAKAAWNAGATVVHLHFRRQEPAMGAMPSWDPEVAASIVDAIRAECPATVEDDRHDQRITRCLALYRAGQLPI